MQVYRGHKGRVELQIVAKGRSAHAASNELGDNAVYKMLPVIAGVRDLGADLPSDPFLGRGRITVTGITCRTASINAVPDECAITIDRRLTFGETQDDAIAQVRALIPAEQATDFTVSMLHYDEPSYTGFVLPVEKYFPALGPAGGARPGASRPGDGPPSVGRTGIASQVELQHERHVLDGAKPASLPSALGPATRYMPTPCSTRCGWTTSCAARRGMPSSRPC